MKVGEYLLVRVRAALRVGAEGEIEDRRVTGKARDTAQDILKGKLVGPYKCHAIAKSFEVALERSTPELAECAGPDHHEDLPGLGQYLQNVIDYVRKIVDDRDRTFVLPKRRAAKVSLIH